MGSMGVGGDSSEIGDHPRLGHHHRTVYFLWMQLAGKYHCPDSITTIGDSAFAGCTSLTSITIPDSVTAFGAFAFSSCSSLKTVTIPDSVTTIEEHAFSRRTSLATLLVQPVSANLDAAEGRVLCRPRQQMVWTVMHVAERLEFLPSEMWMLIFTFVKHAHLRRHINERG